LTTPAHWFDNGRQLSREAPMHRPYALIAAAAMAMSCRPAAAQEHPLLLPTRDVIVDYVTTGGPTGGNQPHTMRMYIAANGTKMRVETPAMPGWLIIDRAGKHMFMVLRQQHITLEMPMDPAKADMFLPHDMDGFTRQGSAKVAGLACTLWSVRGGNRAGSSGCITADGVLLRGESTGPDGQRITLAATAVKYGKLPADTFQPPAGFKKMDLPAGLPPGALTH
jgi:hypothetical protein